MDPLILVVAVFFVASFWSYDTPAQPEPSAPRPRAQVEESQTDSPLDGPDNNPPPTWM